MLTNEAIRAAAPPPLDDPTKYPFYRALRMITRLSRADGLPPHHLA